MKDLSMLHFIINKPLKNIQNIYAIVLIQGIIDCSRAIKATFGEKFIPAGGRQASFRTGFPISFWHLIEINMRASFFYVTALLVFSLSCKKDHGIPGTNIPPVNNPVNTPNNDAPRLKDMIINRLPSPYYHVDYDDSGNVIGVNYQSGARIYAVSYTNKKISLMENIIEPVRDKLEYVYENGRVIRVNIVNRNGLLYRKAFISYNASNKLMKVYWEVLDNGAFSSEQMLVFTYHPDGNLKTMENTTFTVGPLTEGSFIETYDNYDDKVNAGGFDLLLPLPQNHLILLPDYKLQLNNPRHVVRTGTGTVDYNLDYQYTYDDKGRPVSRTGDLVFTTGNQAGQHFTTNSTYSWY
jgi:hypothetical protein